MAKYYSPSGNFEVWDEKPDGYYTEEEWAALHPAPEPPAPTKSEKLAALDARYDAEKDELKRAYLDAVIYDDSELADSIKSEIAVLDAKYDDDYDEIESEE